MKKTQPHQPDGAKPMFDRKAADAQQPISSPVDGQPMVRAFRIEPMIVNNIKVFVRGQHWECQQTGALLQDAYQMHCSVTAAKLAADRPGVHTFYYARAWRAE